VSNLGAENLYSEEDLPNSAIESQPKNPEYQLIFFGGFQVYNKNIEDITGKFSPLLKELFLLIWLHTFKNDKGISSEKITEILWYDKSEKSARNNRAVNIAKLRTILNEIGNCELTKKTGYWKIICNNQNEKSDYNDFLKITRTNSNLSKQKINRLIEVSRKGAFLLNVNYEWLDDFKACVSDRIIDTLVTFTETCDIKKDDDFLIHLADCIFTFDKVNEEAMIFKCKAQYKMGKHSLAQQTYGKFIKEYQHLYDQEYEIPFANILN
jgi:two-component SAPR family response regulator